MPKPKEPQIRAWSYSRWQTYDECPARAKYLYVDRLSKEEEKSPALERGGAIHEEAKLYVQGHYGKKAKLPESLGRFDNEFAILRRAWDDKKHDVFLEEQWAYTSDWEPTEWFAPDAWARVVLDAMISDWPAKRAMVIDHKTGRVRPEKHASQLSLYGLAVLARFENVERVHATLWYLDHGVAHGESYTRDQLAALKKEWEGRVDKMLADRRFDPKPSSACQWCPFSKSKGGPCRY